MITVTVEEAPAQMSKLLKKVKAGETVIITSGPENTPVGRLVPLAADAPKAPGA